MPSSIDRRRLRTQAVTATPTGPPGGIEHSFQREHLLAASYFVAMAKRIESRGAAAVGAEGMTRHRASVTGAIVSSVAFLESSINELYLEFQRAGDDGSAIPTRAHTQLETLWPSADGAPLMLRYQVALQSVDAERFNERRSTYKNVERLLELRDALVHHQPERHDERQRHQSLQRRLRTCFSPNTLLGPRARWFPDLCLGAGCATWALRSAEAFSNEFCIRMGIPSRVRPTRDARRPRPPRVVVPPI
ncbi:MAG TPA: hypothetical protein VFD64_00775 [Gemmatimonadaceae bacterium]|nr:hypothetical protein [Gemmatimonadaceae bacterium]